MRYRPFESYLGNPMKLQTGNFYNEKEVLSAAKEFTKQFTTPPQEQENGIKLIADERARQIQKEGWNTSHDKEHGSMELAGAAGCYVANAINKFYAEDTLKDWGEKARFQFKREPELNFLVNDGDRGDRKLDRGGWRDGFPFDAEYDKRDKHDKIRSLVIAGALIAAELDRLNGTTPATNTPTPPQEQEADKLQQLQEDYNILEYKYSQLVASKGTPPQEQNVEELAEKYATELIEANCLQAHEKTWLIECLKVFSIRLAAASSKQSPSPLIVGGEDR